MMKWIVTFAWFLFVSAASAAGSYVQPNPYFDVPKDLAETANAYDLARLQKDGAKLNSLIAEDYEGVDENAAISDKAAAIAKLTDPQNELQPYVIVQAKHIMRTDSAVLAGTYTLKWVRSGRALSREVRYVDFWAKRKGHWELVFSQFTPIPPPVE